MSKSDYSQPTSLQLPPVMLCQVALEGLLAIYTGAPRRRVVDAQRWRAPISTDEFGRIYPGALATLLEAAH
jgi:hypothetical protein